MAEKSVSPAFLKVIKDNFEGFQKTITESSKLAWITNQKTGLKEARLRYRPQGDTQILGYMDRAVIDAFGEKLPGFELESTLLIHQDITQQHVEGGHKQGSSPQQVWPESFRNALPDHLLKYQAIFWDVENESLLYVPQTAFNESVPFASFKRTKQGHWLLVSAHPAASLLRSAP